MLSEAQIQSVALFFFYSCMDEETGIESISKTLDKCRKQRANSSNSDRAMAATIVRSTYQIWKKWQSSASQLHLSMVPESGWRIPAEVQFGVWQDFRRSADSDELLAVIWSRLLKFTDEEIAEGLDVTEGTVRHRVGRGLRHLGHIKKGIKT